MSEVLGDFSVSFWGGDVKVWSRYYNDPQVEEDVTEIITRNLSTIPHAIRRILSMIVAEKVSMSLVPDDIDYTWVAYHVFDDATHTMGGDDYDLPFVEDAMRATESEMLDYINYRAEHKNV